ncbi:MAG TPA: hypothetical protein VN108_08675 [Marmoricola sp.]|nr:hypothetical protein [Marmoricola sp.]
MSNTIPPNGQGSEGITTRAWVTFVLVAAALLFVVFFTWFQNTSNLDKNPTNNPVSGPGNTVSTK